MIGVLGNDILILHDSFIVVFLVKEAFAHHETGLHTITGRWITSHLLEYLKSILELIIFEELLCILKIIQRLIFPARFGNRREDLFRCGLANIFVLWDRLWLRRDRGLFINTELNLFLLRANMAGRTG